MALLSTSERLVNARRRFVAPLRATASLAATLARPTARGLYGALLRSRARAVPIVDAASPVIVFAPHADDETLGCGGTIAALRRAGVAVTIVCCTDGAVPNPCVSPREMAAIRAEELVAAAGVLGVDRESVRFLGFPDGRLGDHHAAAVTLVCALLELKRPRTVLVPYRHDLHPDHVATNRIVLDAIAKTVLRPVVYEYPIWFWCHWPLVRGVPDAIGALSTPVAGIRACLAMLQDFAYAADVRDVLDVKRRALACHRSQVVGLGEHPRWTTLRDVSGGEFLSLLLGPTELFARAVGPAIAPVAAGDLALRRDRHDRRSAGRARVPPPRAPDELRAVAAAAVGATDLRTVSRGGA